jgi:hypothetical protein
MRSAPPRRPAAFRTRIAVSLAALGSLVAAAAAADDFDEDPIFYSSSRAADPVARLAERIERGEVQLDRDERHGYLPSLMRALDVPVSSQMLVFAKTSFQRQNIAPATPRAVYFSDEVYLGWVQGGEVVEIAAVDPRLGGVFYTLDQRPAERPRLVRRGAECLQCHSSSLTRGVPGHIVRSVYPDADGQPVLSAGTFLTDHRSPLRERWGGWYVSGTHGAQLHLGNGIVRDRDRPEDFDLAAGANLTDLGRLFDVGPYLSPHSDIAALMVLEHQTLVENLITSAGFQARRALRDQEVIERMLETPSPEPSASTRRRLDHAIKPLLEALFLSGEARLEAPIRGTSAFAAEFEKRGPRDSKGRSLRQLDLERRLFKHPLSYLILSPAFDALPKPLLDRLYERLLEVLGGRDRSREFAHLSDEDRRAILEILIEVKPGLPAAFREALAPKAEDL